MTNLKFRFEGTMNEKRCFKCGEEKPLSEFYCHKAMTDGHLNKCKACTKKDVKIHRAANIEVVQAYDRKRSSSEHRIAERYKRARKIRESPELRESKARSQSIWGHNNREKRRAHLAVRRAINKGTLTRQPCERCGNIKSEGHHEDYSKPLEVVWLCRQCHGNRHAEINEQLRQSKQVAG